MMTKKPNKQRKMLFGAPLHRKHKALSAHLARTLIEKYNKRSLPVRKGDEVKVMRGEHRGKTGKITRVDLKNTKVYIDSVKRKKVSGAEINVPLHPSNLLILTPVMDDKKRMQTKEKGEKIGETKKTNNS